MMLKRITVGIFYCSIVSFFCLFKQIPANGTQYIYTNKKWNFQINLPQGWHYIERDQVIKQIKGLNQESYELLRKSELIVNISEYPFGSGVGFNPNISISARNIVITPQPATDNQIVEYAKKLLLSLGKGGNITDIQQGKVNELISVSSDYEYQLQSSNGPVSISNSSTILISKATNNFFIITATCKKENKELYSPIFKVEIASFKEGAK